MHQSSAAVELPGSDAPGSALIPLTDGPLGQGPRVPAALSAAGLACVLVGVLLPVTDFFIVNVALPSMANELGASTALLQLVIAGYATAYAVLLVLGGRLGDAFGRRRLFLYGMAAFTVASLLCALSPTAATLIAGRVLQGAAAALMVPQTLSTIQAVGDEADRARGISWYGAAAGIGAVLGQVLGGLLVGADVAGLGWRPIFLVNVPVGIVGLVVAARYVPETSEGRSSHLDWPGTGLLGVGLVALLLPLTEGRALGWPWWSWALLGTVPVTAGALVAVETRVERAGRTPLLPPQVVSLRSMRRGLGLICPVFAGFAAFMFVYALVSQGPLGYSPLTAGLAIVPLAVTFLGASLAMPRAMARWGNGTVVAGALVQFAGLAGLAVTLVLTWPHVTPSELAPAFSVVGAGQGLAFPALFRITLSEVPVRLAGAGSGVLTTSQQVSLAVGVATLGSVFLALEPGGRLGPEDAVLVILCAQALTAVAAAAGVPWLRPAVAESAVAAPAVAAPAVAASAVVES